MNIRFQDILPLLVNSGLRFIVIGAVGRPKDFEVIAELQALLEERRARQSG